MTWYAARSNRLTRYRYMNVCARLDAVFEGLPVRDRELLLLIAWATTASGACGLTRIADSVGVKIRLFPT